MAQALRAKWPSRSASRTVMRALQDGESVELVCTGWRARLVQRFLPRWLDSQAKLGLRDLLMQVALGRLVAICTYGEGIGRPIETREEGDGYAVLFKRRQPPQSVPSEDMFSSMIRPPGLLVVNRLELMRKAERAGSLAYRDPALAISAEEIFRRYRGLDGVAWPTEGHPPLRTEDGLAEPSQLAAIEQYARKPPFPHDNDIILLVPGGASNQDIQGLGWRAIGFDVGFFESELSHFSVVLNEVIWGRIDELRSFAGKLNEHLLLKTLGDAQALARVHDSLAREGRDVEDGEVEPFAIYVPEAGARTATAAPRE